MTSTREDLCRLCCKPAENRKSIFQQHSKHQKPLSQMIESCTGIKIHKLVCLPQHVCGRCYEQLDFVYPMWERCRASRDHPKCPPGEEYSHYQCRICAREDTEELIGVDCPSSSSSSSTGEMPICEILREFAGLAVQTGDGLSPYLCDVCLGQLERAFEFRRHCLREEAVLLKEYVYPWERMEFQIGDPAKLVIEPHAVLEIDKGNPRIAKCSVCRQRQSPEECKNSCPGCWLIFSNVDEWWKQLKQNSTKTVQQSRDSVSQEKFPARKNDNEDDPMMISHNRVSEQLKHYSLSLTDAFQTVRVFPFYTKVQRNIPVCCGCRNFFITKEALEKHRAQEHAKPSESSGQFICDKCFKSFDTEGCHLRHINFVESGRHDFCTVCDQILLDSSIEEHFKERHQPEWEKLTEGERNKSSTESDNNAEIPCDHKRQNCKTIVPLKGPRKFLQTVAMRLEDVFYVTTANSRGAFSELRCKQNYCCICRHLFLTKLMLQDHITVAHHGLPPTTSTESTTFRYCKVCDHIFLDDSKFHLHLQSVHVTDELKQQIESQCKEVKLQLWRKKGEKSTAEMTRFACKVGNCGHTTASKDEHVGHCLRRHFEMFDWGAALSEDAADTPECASQNNSVEVSAKLVWNSSKFQGKDILNALSFVNKESTKVLAPLEFFKEMESSQIVPLKHFEQFLRRTTLRMENLFDVLAVNQYHVRIRRKRPLCCACDIIFFNERALAAHKSKMHPKPTVREKFTCDTCWTRFDCEKPYKCHVEKLKRPNSVYDYCKLCDEIFLNSHFAQHLFTKHMEETNQNRFKTMFASVMIYGCPETEILTMENHATSDYKCLKCGGLFEGSDELVRHTKRKNFTKYSCKISDCTYKTFSEDDIMEHCLLVSHADLLANFASYVAYLELSIFFKLDPNVPELPYRKIRKKGPMCCGCNMFFQREPALARHCKTTHPKQKDTDAEWFCEVCQNQLGTAVNNKRHIGKRNATTFDYCKTCQLVLADGSFYRHQSVKHPPTDEQVCRIEAKFSKQTDIRYRCCVAQCDSRFTTVARLTQHFNVAHKISESVDENTCRYCGVRFETNEKLTEHATRQYKAVSYSCRSEECEFSTRSREQMLKHGTELCRSVTLANGEVAAAEDDVVVDVELDRQMDQNEKVSEIIEVFENQGVLCCGCRTLWQTDRELRKHVKASHPKSKDNRLFRCPTCNKGFFYKTNMQNHRKIATSPKYYRCRLCNVVLQDMQQVSHHVLYIHDSDVPKGLTRFYTKIEFEQFPCCGCTRQFPTVEELAEHCKESHPARPQAPVRTSTCSHCHQQFENHDDYLSHVVFYARKLFYKCSIRNCSKKTTSLQAIEHHVSVVPHEVPKLTEPMPPKAHIKQKSTTCSSKNCHEERKRALLYYENPREYHCCVQPCAFHSSSYESLIVHGVRKHSEFRQVWEKAHSDNTFSCPVCCKKFGSKQDMLSHRQPVDMKYCTCRPNKRPYDFTDDWYKHGNYDAAKDAVLPDRNLRGNAITVSDDGGSDGDQQEDTMEHVTECAPMETEVVYC